MSIDELRAHIIDLADALHREAADMLWAGGESPRPHDFAEGHYIGTMKTLHANAKRIRALATPDARKGDKQA